MFVATTESCLGIIGKSAALAAHIGRLRIVGARAILSWTIRSFIPHADWPFYRLPFDGEPPRLA